MSVLHPIQELEMSKDLTVVPAGCESPDGAGPAVRHHSKHFVNFIVS